MSGLETYGRTQALEALLNLTESTFVGLLDTLPVDSIGEVEISPAGYTRVLNQDWSTTDAGGVTTRSNVPLISFGPYPTDVSMRGWAIYDAPVAGNLIASGLFFDTGGGQAGEVFVEAGDDIQFQPGQFGVSIGDECPVVIGAAGGDTCSDIDTITVDVGGGPVAWSIGDPPVAAPATSPVTVVITLVAASTDMPGFVENVTNAAMTGIVDGAQDFTVTYTTSPAGAQLVTVENTNNSPTCTYDLGPVTTVA